MSKSDPKHLWIIINDAMYNKVNNHKKVNISSIIDSKNKIITDDAGIAYKFNSFFTTVGENIAEQIKPHNPVINYKPKIKVYSNYSTFLNNITKEEFKRLIPSSKESTSFFNSFFNYNLSNHILKQIVDYILVPLEYIFNLCLFRSFSKFI